MEKLTLHDFVSAHSLKAPVRGLDDSSTIDGRRGFIFVFDAHRFGVVVMLHSRRAWSASRAACEAVGMEVRQLGDTEGALLFSPDKHEQAAVAIKAAGIYKKRRAAPPTPAQLAALSAGRKKLRAATAAV